VSTRVQTFGVEICRPHDHGVGSPVDSAPDGDSLVSTLIFNDGSHVWVYTSRAIARGTLVRLPFKIFPVQLTMSAANQWHLADKSIQSVYYTHELCILNQPRLGGDGKDIQTGNQVLGDLTKTSCLQGRWVGP